MSPTKIKHSTPPSPPPLPPLPTFLARKSVAQSVTNQEIAKFWKQKHIDEEDHLLAAIKATARLRARRMRVEDYKQFEESLNDERDTNATKAAATADGTKMANNNEVRVGIKDWWTKSKYAYLNQPASEAANNLKRRTSTYVPNYFSFKPTPLYPSSLGVF